VKDIWDNILIYSLTNPFICKTNENAFGKANLCMGENPSYKKWFAEFINPKSIN
jgi:hypothetical protein